MWFFGAVSVALATPFVRSCIETLFAELTVVFINWLEVVACCTIAVFCWAVYGHYDVFSKNDTTTALPVEQVVPQLAQQEGGKATSSTKDATNAVTSKGENASCTKYLPLVARSKSKCKQSKKSRHSASVLPGKSMNGSGNTMWTTLFFAATLLPVTLVVGGSAQVDQSVASSRRLANDSSAAASSVIYSLADDPIALASIEEKLTTCNYSNGTNCVNNVSTVSAFGDYQRGLGICVAFDAAYVNVTSPIAALPARYQPIDVETAYSEGFANKLSEWSTANQEQFQLDCPLLYNNTILTNNQDYLCCTETQYERLHFQIEQLSGVCTSCKQNLRNVWCQFTCNPSNSMYIDVRQVRIMDGDSNNEGEVFAAIEEATYYMGDDVVRDLYDFCAADTEAMMDLCNADENCTDGYGLLAAMGSYNFDSVGGSAMQINVQTMAQLSESEQEAIICACDDDLGNTTDCFAPMNVRLTSCVGVCGSMCAVSEAETRTYETACYASSTSHSSSQESSESLGNDNDDRWDDLMTHMAERVGESDFHALNSILIVVGTGITCVMVGGFLFAKRYNKKSLQRSTDRQRPANMRHMETTEFEEKRLSIVHEFLMRRMKQWGEYLSHGNRPKYTIMIVLAMAIGCASGLSQLDIETNPVKLWVSNESRVSKERARFGKLFAPYYRTEQLLLVPKDGGSIGRLEYLKEAIRIQEIVTNVIVGSTALDDICWKATGVACTVNAITQYFQNRMDHFEFYDTYGLAMKHFHNCLSFPETNDGQVCLELQAVIPSNVSIPTSMGDCPCLSTFGAPMNMYNAYLGGLPDGAEMNSSRYGDATAMVSTVLIRNYDEEEDNESAIVWEREFIAQMKAEAAENDLFDISFVAESSIEDELDAESSDNARPVIICGVCMIFYLLLVLNWWTQNSMFLETSKIVVSLLGVFSIMFAVAMTLGVFLWMGVKVQLVIIPVVPALALAIGANHLISIVDAIQQKQTELMREQPLLFVELEHDHDNIHEIANFVVSEGIGQAGPTIVFNTLAQSVVFALGWFSPMPVMYVFAAFTTVAVILNAVLQVTFFLAVVTMDKRREYSAKYDILCWKKKRPATFDDYWSDMNETSSQIKERTMGLPRETVIPEITPKVGMIDRFVNGYCWLLFSKSVKLAILLLFAAWTLLSIRRTEQLDHGLPPTEFVSSTSYITSYFDTLEKYVDASDPVYFVVEGGYEQNPEAFDLYQQDVQAQFCKSKAFCDAYSVPAILDVLVTQGDPSITHFSNGMTYSWLDEFWSFTNPDSECCRVDGNNAYAPIAVDNATYLAQRSTYASCLAIDSSMVYVPKESFMSLFSMFVTANASALCPYGGGPLFNRQFSVDNEPLEISTISSTDLILNSTSYGYNITAFSYKLTLAGKRTQQVLIDGYAQARRVVDWISETTGIEVWAYSPEFVYFDQYLRVILDTYLLVGFAILTVSVIYTIQFGSFCYALVVVQHAVMTVIQVMALMQPCGIFLNGVSMVCLIAAVGLSVEFSVHFVHQFARTQGTGDERAKDALREVLVSVLFRNTVIKVVAFSPLCLAGAGIVHKYILRMLILTVICGLLNGALLLPVLLSVLVDTKQCRGRYSNGRRRSAHNRDGAESPAYRTTDSL